jgi:hypothetical protein
VTLPRFPAIWNAVDIPLCKGQKLVGLKTHTDNHTIYLFDYDGRQVGWISGDQFSKQRQAFEPTEKDIFIVTVLQTFRTQFGGRSIGKLQVEVAQHGCALDAAEEFREQRNWPLRISMQDFPGIKAALRDESNQPPAAPKGQTKGTSMNIPKNAVTARVTRAVAANKDAMENAAYLEAGFIANKQLGKLLAAKAPFMVRGYVETAIGRLVIANLASAVIAEFRPDHTLLGKLSHAMMVDAHQEVIKTLDIDGLIDELLSGETLQRALGKLKEEGGEA